MLVYQRVCPNSRQELLAMGLLLRSFLPSHECFCWPWCSLWLAGPAQENALAQNSQEPNLLTSTLSKDAKLRKIIGSKTQHVNKLIKIYKNQINQTQQKTVLPTQRYQHGRSSWRSLPANAQGRQQSWAKIGRLNAMWLNHFQTIHLFILNTFTIYPFIYLYTNYLIRSNKSIHRSNKLQHRLYTF